MKRRIALTTAAALLLTAGCSGFRFPRRTRTGFTQPTTPVAPSPPSVRVVSTQLARAPGRRDIGLYYCMQRAPTPLICRAFGPLPTDEDLRFAFDVELEFQNPTQQAMPVVQALFAFTAFPESLEEENLGAVCMSFCEDPANCTASAESACQSTEPEIRDLDDFRNAARGFLISVAMGERRFEDLRIRTIEPGETMRMVVRLEIAHEQMMRLIQASIGGAIEGVTSGQVPEITIPFQLEGSAWVTVEGFGRLAAGFGPIRDEWNLAETALQATSSQ